MRRTLFILLALAPLFAGALRLDAQGTRQLRLAEDRSQQGIVSKVYELKSAAAADLAPFVEGAVKRANPASTVAAASAEGHEKLVVTMPRYIVESVDEMVLKLDKPSEARDSSGSIVQGTGVANSVYRPKFISGKSAAAAIGMISEDSGGSPAFYDASNNMVYWKGPASASDAAIRMMDRADAPSAQAMIVFKLCRLDKDSLAKLESAIAARNKEGAPVPDASLLEALEKKGLAELVARGSCAVRRGSGKSSLTLGDGMSISIVNPALGRDAQGVFLNADVAVAFQGGSVMARASFTSASERLLASFSKESREDGRMASIRGSELAELLKGAAQRRDSADIFILTGKVEEAAPGGSGGIPENQRKLIEDLEKIRK